MNVYKKILPFIDKHTIRGTKATWGLFCLYAFVIFTTVIAAHWFFFRTIPVYALLREPSMFFACWIPKICISLFLAFFVLISKRKWWTVVLLCLIDCWIIANLIYSRANNCLLTWDAIMMVENLGGFESSIGFYWNWECNFFLLMTCVYTCCVFFFQPTSVNTKAKSIVAILVVGLYFLGTAINVSRLPKKFPYNVYQCYIPFYTDKDVKKQLFSTQYYLYNHSIIASFPEMIFTHFAEKYAQRYTDISYTEREQKILSQLIQTDSTHYCRPVYNLCFVLIESLESFALECVDTEGNYLLPNLHALLSSNVLYADKLTSQVRHGVSADGQLIYNTGLLPIQNGAAAMIYGNNTYPNYASMCDISIPSNPVHGMTWNQTIMTKAYGYKKEISTLRERKDYEIFADLKIMNDTCDSTICFFAITMDSHSPFHRIKLNPLLQFDPNMPEMMQKYLNCLHYTDSCFGEWYHEWKKTSQADNTILVVTGDHTVFKDAILQDFIPYAKQTDLSIASGKTYCPLIIQTPQIKENIKITDVCYQMDVYPTILHLMGCENYYWKGFGVNLLDSLARQNRFFTEEEAYRLSDKLIQDNYFLNIVSNLDTYKK